MGFIELYVRGYRLAQLVLDGLRNIDGCGSHDRKHSRACHRQFVRAFRQCNVILPLSKSLVLFLLPPTTTHLSMHAIFTLTPLSF